MGFAIKTVVVGVNMGLVDRGRAYGTDNVYGMIVPTTDEDFVILRNRRLADVASKFVRTEVDAGQEIIFVFTGVNVDDATRNVAAHMVNVIVKATNFIIVGGEVNRFFTSKADEISIDILG